MGALRQHQLRRIASECKERGLDSAQVRPEHKAEDTDNLAQKQGMEHRIRSAR